MKPKNFFSITVLGALLAVAGCGKKDGGAGGAAANSAPQIPETPQEAASVIERQFVSAPPEARRNAQELSQAFRERQYESAVKSVIALESQAQTKEQKWAVYNSKIRLQQDIARALDSGDPNAKAAAELFKRRYGH